MFLRHTIQPSQPRWRRTVAVFGVPQSVREFFRCHVLRPLLRLLRGGVTPRRMAWSLALGMMIGINPTVGITTVLLILLAWIFRLSQTASQLGMHAMAPLHVLLFLPFMQAGVYLFHTRKLPFTRQQLHHLSHHPVLMVRTLWEWQWHALVVWGVIAVVLTPLLAIYLRRALVMLMRRHPTLMHAGPATH